MIEEKPERHAVAGAQRADGRREAGVDPSDLAVAFTPKQIIGGFALLAALVMLLRRRDRDARRR
jgi:hypothetical protein